MFPRGPSPPGTDRSCPPPTGAGAGPSRDARVGGRDVAKEEEEEEEEEDDDDGPVQPSQSPPLPLPPPLPRRRKAARAGRKATSQARRWGTSSGSSAIFFSFGI